MLKLASVNNKYADPRTAIHFTVGESFRSENVPLHITYASGDSYGCVISRNDVKQLADYLLNLYNSTI